MTDNTASRANPALYLGLGLVTCSMLLLQQFLTRIFTVQFNSSLAFLAISITFLGLGSAGVAAALAPRFFAMEKLPRLIPRLALTYSLSLVLCVIVAVMVGGSSGKEVGGIASQVMRLLIASAIMLPPLFLAGLVISLVIKMHASRVHRLYGADLLGGGLGCLLVLPLMSEVGGDDGVFLIGSLAALGASGLSIAHRRWGVASLGVVTAVLLGLGPKMNEGQRIIDVRSHRSPLEGVQDWVRGDREIYREWNELSRIGVYETTAEMCLYVQIDSGCQTTIPSHKADYDSLMADLADIENLPYLLDRHKTYLEIGAGGGRGMMLAKAQGAEEITGVEINPTIVDSTLGRFPGFGIKPMLEDGRNLLINDEGRSYLRGSDKKYDTVTITFIQTGVASASAAFALSEANLFTVEAFSEYIDKLTDDGLFYIYRHGGNELLRLVALTREALQRRGIQDPRPYLFVAQSKQNRSIVMVSRRPFTKEEISKLEQGCRDNQLQVAFSPRAADPALQDNPLFSKLKELRAQGSMKMGDVVSLYEEYKSNPGYKSLARTFLESKDPDALIADYVIDVRPPTDDRPYYFFFGINHLSDFPLYFSLKGLDVLGGTVILLFWMFILFTVLVVVLIALPLFLGRASQKGRGLGWPVILYFSTLGVGYMAVQISFVQRFSLFLGHPVYAISVVILSFLVWTGIGSICSKRLFASEKLTMTRAVIILVAVLLLSNWVLPVVFHSGLISLPVPVRILISMLCILPIAFVMGWFFPRGIELLNRQAPELTPWAWGANSAASVLGSILSLVLAIHLGFAAVSYIAAVLYLAFCIPAGRRLSALCPLSKG